MRLTVFNSWKVSVAGVFTVDPMPRFICFSGILTMLNVLFIYYEYYVNFSRN